MAVGESDSYGGVETAAPTKARATTWTDEVQRERESQEPQSPESQEPQSPFESPFDAFKVEDSGERTYNPTT